LFLFFFTILLPRTHIRIRKTHRSLITDTTPEKIHE
jgi:hypothetical protein